MDDRQINPLLLGLAQVIVVQEPRLGVEQGHHTAQLAQPEFHLDLQKERSFGLAGLFWWAGLAGLSGLARMGHQSEQTGQPQPGEALILAGRKTATQQGEQILQQDRFRPETLQITQQILEGEVGFQPLTERTTPGDIRYLLRRDVLPEPQRNLCRQIGGQILILFRRQRRDISRLGLWVNSTTAAAK